MKKENTVEKEEDDWFWSISSNPMLCLLQNKVMFLQKIMLIYDKPLLSGQPPFKEPLASTPRLAA